MESFKSVGETCNREANCLRLPEKCLRPRKHERTNFSKIVSLAIDPFFAAIFKKVFWFKCSKIKLPAAELLVQKKKSNDPRLPRHVDENTVFGDKTKSK